jgi:hypothetical protein
MQDFSSYLTEVFEFDRRDMQLPDRTNLIHYQKKGYENYTRPDGKLGKIPFKEMVFHTPLENAPKDKSNLWVHVMHYPLGYPVQGLDKPHLQVHFDVSHVTDHNYLDELRDSKLRNTTNDPGTLYAKAYAPKDTELDALDFAGGNAYSGVARSKTASGMSFLFRKIAPMIVRTAWHASKSYPKLPIAFSAGSDVPGHGARKFEMYNKIADSLKDSGMIEDTSQLISNPIAFQGQHPMFHLMKPIHV